ncbi:spore wall protein 2 isoform X2 [Dendroctonus ponderosae]|uniref:spore wall protein 2 isoform X2 n=1 Tax=Dendroctonus ponderosae TaxID=77166 RepID=UPI002035269C|nr:spore wall protein 2 isoform X2 [Dendroctonus ponderosae]
MIKGVKDAFLYVYGDAENDDGDVHGYSKRMNDKGQDGYKHLDSFHKRDGDKYGYEKHSEYGQEHKSKIDNENEKGIKQAQKEAGGGDGNGEESKSFYSIFGESDKDDKKQAKKNVEAEFNYYGGNGDSGSSSYGGSSEKAEKDGEGSESSIGDDGEGESYEESEESGEGGEEGNDEEEY